MESFMEAAKAQRLGCGAIGKKINVLVYKFVLVSSFPDRGSND
jgi:hypothetical protein